MARYESKYTKLGFYVHDTLKNFLGGVYETDDKDEIEVLDALADAIRVDEPKTQPKTEAKPETKTSTRKTTSAK